MKKFFLLVAALLVFVIVFPFLAPSLGLAEFREQAHVPHRSVEVEDGTLNVQEWGSGERAVILVHGQPGSADMMRPLAEAMAYHGYRVYAYDRMGWGHSTPRRDGVMHNPTAHGRDLLQLSDALGLSQPLVVGYSYGGGVTMEANRLAPQVFPRVVLVSSVGGPRQRGQQTLLGKILFSAPVMHWVFGMDLIAMAAADRIFASLQHPEQLSDSEQKRFMATLALPGVVDNWNRERSERYVDFERYQPETVSACALIIHGTDDQIVDSNTASYIAEQLPGAQYRPIKRAGHALIVTQPQRLAEMIRLFDERCP